MNATGKPAIVSFKDADKIKSWDAWHDHQPEPETTSILQNEKRCVTWEKLLKLDPGLPASGWLATRGAADIEDNDWSIGCETMDRDYADWDSFKELLPTLGVKHVRFLSGWAKTEQEKGVYDFTWLDPHIRESAAMGVKPWVCICYGNPVWGSDFRLGMRVKQITDDPEAFDAWLRYVKALVTRYKDVVDEWEVWNEPFFQADEYAELFYRTAKAVREVQPNAKCYCTAIAMKSDMPKSDYEVVLEKLKSENALDLGSRFIYHPYAANPDTSYGTVDGKIDWALALPLRRLVKSYSDSFDIMQGEVGCPSQLEFAHALNGIEWTEYSQAKWNLRRAIGDAARAIPSSCFTMIDLKYTFMLQSFGLIRSNLLKEFVYRRPSFHAMQHVYSIFDKTVRPLGVDTLEANGRALTVATFERGAQKFSVIWYSDSRPSDVLAYDRIPVARLAEAGAAIPPDCAWLDLLNGRICRLEGDEIPVWDSPVALAPDGLLPRRAQA